MLLSNDIILPIHIPTPFQISSFSNPATHTTCIYTTLTAPPHSRIWLEVLRHKETTRPRTPTHPVDNTNPYYLDQDLIIFTIETLYHLSPYNTTSFYPPPPPSHLYPGTAGIFHMRWISVQSAPNILTVSIPSTYISPNTNQHNTHPSGNPHQN